MSFITQERGISAFSTSTTDSVRSSLSASTSATASLSFLDDPLGSWKSIFLAVLSSVALCSYAIFLGYRYAEVLRPIPGIFNTAPRTLEAQVPSDTEEYDRHLDSELFGPYPPYSPGHDDHSEIRRRPQATYIQSKTVPIGEVRQGKIAQRRASSARDTAKITQAHEQAEMATFDKA